MIETLTDWNTRLGYCGCCEMPACPTPVLTSQKIDADASLSWQVFTTGVGYKRDRRTSYADGGHELMRNIPAYKARINGVTFETAPLTLVETVPPLTGAATFTYENIISAGDITTARAEGYARLETEKDWDTDGISTGSGKSKRTNIEPVGGSSDNLISVIFFRFRFRIPTSHLGSYFKITYDIGEFPTTGDPSFVSQDNVVEWTGPGSGASSDPSWLTPWVEVDPPTDPGERRVVNIRFTCYHGTKYGVKPQVTGEALEIPPP